MSKTKQKPRSKPARKTAHRKTDDCPYRPDSLYGQLFSEGNKRYRDRDELIAAVARKTRKTQRVVRYSYNVLSNRRHRSNGGRSSIITNDEGRIKLISLKKRSR